MRDKIVDRMLDFMQSLKGMDYSRTYRLNYYKSGSADCSSLVAGAMSYAGFPLLDSNKKELYTSCYEVNAEGYDLLYPSKKADIGKKLPSAAGLAKSLKLQPGDLVFFNFNSKTTRANKITHVAAVLNENQYIHTANNREKCCIVPISWGDGRICAITRLKSNVKTQTLPTIKKGSTPKYIVRILQTNLNFATGSRLTCDGVFGENTEKQLNIYKAKKRLPQNGVCDLAVWNSFFNITTHKEDTYVQIIGNSVYVRAGGSVNYKSLGIARKGETYLFLGTSSSGWYKINYNGKAAYISNRSDLTKKVNKWTCSRVLKRTSPLMSGEDVMNLKKTLVEKGYLHAATKNTFGDDTDKAVRKFQKDRNLSVDGKAGKNTITALGGVWIG